MKRLYIAYTLLLLIGCKPVQTIVQTDTANTSETKKDTIERLVFAPDSMKLKLLFECDSNNNVLIRENSELKTKGFNTSYKFINNTLDLSIYTDSIEQLNRIIETTKSKETVKHNPIDPILLAENEKLKGEKQKLIIANEALQTKAARKNMIIFGLLAFMVIFGAILKILK